MIVLGALVLLFGLDHAVVISAEPTEGEQQIGPPLGRFTVKGTAQPKGALQLTLTVVDANGRQAQGTVTITDINLWPPPGLLSPRNCDQFAAAIESRAKFAQAKAQKIADALNANANIAAAHATFNPAKKISVSTFNNAEDGYIKALGKGINIDNIYDHCAKLGKPLPVGKWGLLVFPSVPNSLPAGRRVLDVSPAKDAQNRVLPGTDETGDGWRFRPRTGTTGSLGRDPAIGLAAATGVDGTNNPSVIEFGIKGQFVAEFPPSTGMSDQDVLLAIGTMLTQAGIAASFDSQNVALGFNLPGGKTLAWGQNDTGLEFQTGVAPVAFPQCPPVGNNTGCQFLITLREGSITLATDPNQGPYDSVDNALVGVVNSSFAVLKGLNLSGPGAFAFDSNGACGASINPQPLGCPFGPTTYEGPRTSFVVVDNNNGIVQFSGGLKREESAYFSLESPPVTVSPLP